VRSRVLGYLPIVQIKGDRTDRGDRIAATIRHNRARGKHSVTAMSEIVLELKRRNWSDTKIGKQLGMDSDEIMRLAQITGLAVAFANRNFSEAWEAVIHTDDEDDLNDTEVLNACMHAHGVTEKYTRSAWWLMSQDQRDAANAAANLARKRWTEAREGLENA
jgi:hypothetical protein